MGRRFLVIIFIIALLIAAAGALVYWQMTPSVIAHTPLDGAENIPANTKFSITFSRPMKPDTVINRLTFDPSRSGAYTWQDNKLVFTPDEPWSNSKTIQVRLAAGAQAEGVVSLPTRQASAWSFTTGEPRLVYLYPADGPANIYALNPSTGESVQLTNFPGGILGYDVDSSGSMLYFSRKTGQNGSSIYRLAINDETQSEPQELISCPHATCRAPSISPLGDYLAYELTAFVGEDNPAYPQVWLLPLPPEIEIGFAGLEPFKAGEPLHQTLQPHWSSNGLLAFYDTSQNAFVILDPVDGETVLFPNQTGQPGSWHPSGDSYTAAEIFFIEIEASDETAGLDQIGSSHLMLFDLSDQSIEDLTQMDNLEDTSPAFSPDGNWLAFARKYLDIQKWTPGRQLWLMDIENRKSAQLTNNPIYNHFEFSWDSTGSQLAFVRFNQTQPVEPPEIWVIDPNTTLTRPIVEGGYAPQWIP